MCMVKFGVLALGLAFPLWTFTAVFGVPVEGQPNVIGPRSVRAAPGEDVILPCHVEPQLDLQDYTIEWSKPDLKPQSEVTFVLLYRYKKEVKSVKSEAYVGRTRLFTESLKSGNVSLQIKGVTVEDQGEYKCLVPLLRSRNRQATIRLEVDPSFAPTETSVDPNNFTTPEPTDQTDRESGRSHPGVWISVLVFSFVLLGGGIYLLIKSQKQNLLCSNSHRPSTSPQGFKPVPQLKKNLSAGNQLPSEAGCVFPASPSPDSKNEVLHLHMVPSRSQFFKYDSVYLSCEASSRGGLPKWIISKGVESCPSGRKSLKVSTCNLSDLYPFDSGLYWCETESGDRGPPVNITVTEGPVILESPVYPVMEGDSVALRCTERETSSRLTDFYKDGRLIGSSSTGNMTLHRVSKSNEGLYMCNISGVGSSLSNWLSVQVPDRPDPDPPVMPVHRIICHVVTGIPYLLSTIMLALIHRDKRRASQFVAVDRRHCVVMEME